MACAVVGEQVGGGSFDGDPTLAEYVAVVGDRQGPCGVLFDEDDGEFGPVTQVTQQCEDLFGDQGRQSERGSSRSSTRGRAMSARPMASI